MDEQERNELISKIDGTVQYIFNNFDQTCEILRTNVKVALSDYIQEAITAKRREDVYKNKLQVRPVMEVILPLLSTIKNEVTDADNLDDLKKNLNEVYRELARDLMAVGVELSEHERGGSVAGDERLNLKTIPTSDEQLNGKVSRSKRFGCVIKGEEGDPILEDVELYVYQPTEKLSQEEQTAVDDPLKMDSEINFEVEQYDAVKLDEKKIKLRKDLFVLTDNGKILLSEAGNIVEIGRLYQIDRLKDMSILGIGTESTCKRFDKPISDVSQCEVRSDGVICLFRKSHGWWQREPLATAMIKIKN